MSRAALQAAAAAGEAAGVDSRHARLLRVRTSAIVLLPHAGVIARVEPCSHQDDAVRQVQAARFYEQRGAPTMRLAGAGPQPFMDQGGVVTLWDQLTPMDRPLIPHALGALVKSLHAVAGLPLGSDLPRLDPFSLIRWWQARPVPGFDQGQLQALSARTEMLERQWQVVADRDPLEARLVHGDLTTDNVVVTRRGPLLVDLEMSGVGPASWDLVVPAVATRRFGQPEADFRAVLEAYGQDPTGWDGFELLCETYELLVVAWCVHCSGLSPRMNEEARLRIGTLLGGSGTDRPWTLV